ncbi:MAG TPA: hypothetical protein VHM92_12345 [Allosphingosinicella sp.]|nr:hypothetical protein [Allosphingosinicella sp.]
MGENVTDFVNTWVQENINPTAYAGEGERHPETEQTVEELLAAAESEGISRADIEEHFGDVEDFIDNQFETATDNEVQRLADRDD